MESKSWNQKGKLNLFFIMFQCCTSINIFILCFFFKGERVRYLHFCFQILLCFKYYTPYLSLHHSFVPPSLFYLFWSVYTFLFHSFDISTLIPLSISFSILIFHYILPDVWRDVETLMITFSLSRICKFCLCWFFHGRHHFTIIGSLVFSLINLLWSSPLEWYCWRLFGLQYLYSSIISLRRLFFSPLT